MSVVSRILAVVVAVCGMACGLVGLVRAAALAAGDVAWRPPHWWTALIDAPASWSAAAAAVAAAAAAACLVMAFRQLRGPAQPAVVRVGDVDVKPDALARMVAQRLAAEIAGLTVARVRVDRDGKGWDVVAVVDVPPLGLAVLRDHAVDVVMAELERATGIGRGRLTLDVRRFVGGGETEEDEPRQRKGLGFTRPL